MRKQIFESITKRLACIHDNGDGTYKVIPEDHPDYHQIDRAVKEFGLWNKKWQEEKFPENIITPAVMIEFEPIEWQPMVRDLQEADLVVNVYIIQPDTKLGDPCTAFNLPDAVNLCLNGFKEGKNSFYALRTVTDHEYGDHLFHMESYRCHIVDTSRHRSYDTISISAVDPVIDFRF